ncbi:CGNR zinc finger domain-containing protein [Streptomyces sp. NPDC001985]|uniref:CGNR zinc finger domain-containing protein n=1 Tax=Streptomyces sp. NPDC001985 TaxID=3154406 RepID=UPI00332824F0
MPRPFEADPRPLTGEPLAIDLLNTRWIDATGPHDLLDSLEGLTIWLAGDAAGEALRDHRIPADEHTLRYLLEARTALETLITATPPYPAEAVAALNAVLAHGAVRHTLGPEGPEIGVELDEPSWRPAWTAADNYLGLLADRPARIRPCANPQCVLHFYDVSKNGTRRWCSMAGCGNRAKALRHYARHLQDGEKGAADREGRDAPAKSPAARD